VSNSCENPDSAEWCTPPKPKCTCCGCPGDTDCPPEESCVEAPIGLEIYQSVDASMPAENPAKLPVRLEWNDVPGWGGGWDGSKVNMQAYFDCIRNNSHVDRCRQKAWEDHPDERCWGWLVPYYIDCLNDLADEECKHLLEEEECDATCPLSGEEEPECYTPGEFVKSYKIEITGDLRNCEDGSDMNGYSAVLRDSEFFPPCPCFFKSDREYAWKVRACCSNDGKNCGPWSEVKTFETSLAPEPVWPHDPDWAGPGRADPNWQTPTEEHPYPVHIEWCPVDPLNNEVRSYYLRAYNLDNGEEICPPPDTSHLTCPRMIIIPIDGETEPRSGVSFSLDVFTKETNYEWHVSTCFSEDENAADCQDFSQRWRFYGRTTLPKVELTYPEDEGCANFHSQLHWKHSSGAKSYRYTISQVNPPLVVLQEEWSDDLVVLFSDIWNGNLNIDTTYAWQVKPCWDEEGNDCEDGSISDEWQFTTAGATPTNLRVAARHSVTNRALIPLQLDWDDMPCAASYKYEVTDEFGNIIAEGLTGKSNISVDYDPVLGHPRQNTLYFWQVETCADGGGNICGSLASSDLTTFILDAPENPYPPDGGNFYTNESYLKWDRVEGASFYRYEVIGKIGPTIVPAAQNHIHVLNVATWDLIDYTWWVQACIDENCNEEGPSSTWTFTLVEGEAPDGFGLVPCGRYADNPDTPWKETDPCGFEHIFIMIYSIISYVLWKLIPIVLVLLVIASAIIFYFSGQLGIPDPTAQVKSIWKAVGIGLLVVFLAWIITSVILGLLGYKVGIFGTWWILDF